MGIKGFRWQLPSGPIDFVGSRVRYFREKAGMKQSELARKSGLSNDYVNKIELGKVTNIGSDTMKKLADALGLPSAVPLILTAEELLSMLETNSEPIKDDNNRPQNAFDAPEFEPYDLPVVGLARAGKEGFFDDQGFPVGEGFRKIHRPYTVRDPNAYAVQIDGDSMSPRVYKGDIVIVTPSHEVKNGDLAIARLRSGEVMLKEVRFQDPLVILHSVNPAHDPIAVKKKDLDFLHKVVMIKTK